MEKGLKVKNLFNKKGTCLDLDLKMMYSVMFPELLDADADLIRQIIFFFNVGPPKEDIFSGHLLSPIFQSIFYTLQ